jgi:gas vesicle protein
MRNKFMYGIIAGGMIGMATSAYMANNISPRQRTKLMRRGHKLMKRSHNAMNKANDMMGIVRSIL